jgi:two-component system cell cycle sensor histidine kinase/response regulator CckA
MTTRLLSLCTPSPDGFSFRSEFHARDFRSAPFALYAPSFDEARSFLGAHLLKMAGIIIVSGERLSYAEITPLLWQVTVSPSLLPDLAEFAQHHLLQISRLVGREDRVAFLALENERLTISNQQASEEFSQFRTGLLREIEERRMAERHLAESEERLRLIMSSTGEAIYGIDTEGRCTFANEACLTLLGFEHCGEVLGRNMHELIYVRPPDHTSLPVEECRISEIVRDGKGVTVTDEQFRRRDGSSFPVEYSFFPIRKDDIVVGAVVTWRDITERKRVEEERLKLEQQLQHTQKLESLGVLAGGVAHDFNNILTAIIGNAELALMRINSASQEAGNLKRIVQAAARAADLAKQMLAYSGKGTLVVTTINLNHLMEEIVHMLEVSISKKAELRLNLTPTLPPVEADATQIRQIIMNLVINSSEAIGDKSGVIAITTGYLECDAGYLNDVWLDENIREGLYAYLEITDTGCGMDKEIMSKIFDPFFTTKFTGRGLGMAAVLGIVRGHKGAIKVQSEPDKGTSFKILLPASGHPAELFTLDSREDDWKGRAGFIQKPYNLSAVKEVVRRMEQP